MSSGTAPLVILIFFPAAPSDRGTPRQRDARPGAHSRCVCPAEAATQEAQGCEQKYLQRSFHAHAPFRENGPSRSVTLTRPRPPSVLSCAGVISHAWTPIYAQEGADQSVEVLNRGKRITRERERSVL